MNKMLTCISPKNLAVLYIFLVSLMTTEVYGQVNNNIQQNENSISTQDTLTAKDSVIVKNAFFKLFKGKPGRAALYSLVIPGGGQLYNKKYWKFPIAVAVDGGLGYNLWYQNKQYNTYQNLYTSALLTGSSRVSEYRENRNKFRKAKEFALLYLVLGHVLTTIDAYVDRHLMEFDISTDLTYIVPGNSPVMSLAFSFPIAIQNSHLKKKNRTITLY